MSNKNQVHLQCSCGYQSRVDDFPGRHAARDYQWECLSCGHELKLTGEDVAALLASEATENGQPPFAGDDVVASRGRITLRIPAGYRSEVKPIVIHKLLLLGLLPIGSVVTCGWCGGDIALANVRDGQAFDCPACKGPLDASAAVRSRRRDKVQAVIAYSLLALLVIGVLVVVVMGRW